MSVLDTRIPESRATQGRLAFLRERGMGASILVAAISSAFGVLLLIATSAIAALLRADPYFEGSGSLEVVIAIMSVILVGIAVYVAGIVTANTFSTIIAGRTRNIALMRLIGASARSQRAEVANQGLVVGMIGAALGYGVGVAAGLGGFALLSKSLGLAEVGDVFPGVVSLAPAVVVALTTWLAAWIGSRRVLSVTPLEALGDSGARSYSEVAKPARSIVALVLFVIGAVLLGLGVMAGLVTPFGVVIAFFGGLASFTALSMAAAVIMPPILRLVGRFFGASAPARMAAENALRNPERSSRMAIGVVMGVTLVTMFAVAMESAKRVLTASAGGEMPQEMMAALDSFTAVMMALVSVSAVIAAVGLVNLLVIGVVQRKRELGLLRALGLTNRQVRQMVLLEAAHIAVSAVATGLVLGIVYGWIGAQSLLGSIPLSPGVGPAGTFVLPAVPWLLAVGVVVAAVALTLVAAVVPTRLATRVVPVEALAVD